MKRRGYGRDPEKDLVAEEAERLFRMRKLSELSRLTGISQPTLSRRRKDPIKLTLYEVGKLRKAIGE